MSKRGEALMKAAVLNGGVITKSEAVAAIGHLYYCNAGHHVGEVLSRLVKAGRMKRTLRGVYETVRITERPATERPITAKIDGNQMGLF